MIHINIGYECGDRFNCNMSKKCKYRGNYKFHNMSVNIHRFFEYKLHIKLPHIIYIGKRWERLSGTNKCPYHKSRNYTCNDCKHQCGLRECDVPFKNRAEDIINDEWSKHSKCGSFEKCEWADEYKGDYE